MFHFTFLVIGQCQSSVFALMAVVVIVAWNQSLDAQDALQPILDRIHHHATGEDWKQAGWKDETIEGWLENFTNICAKAAELPALKLPVRFADVTPGEVVPDRAQQKKLLVGKNINLKGSALYNCIVLADGNFSAGSAEGCVIIARGAVELPKSAWSIIVAGTQVVSRADGRAGSLENGSLISTRGWANLQTAYGTILYAGEGATVSLPQFAVFINAVLVANEASNSRSVKIRNLPIEDLPVHPMAERIQLLGVIYPEALDNNGLRLPPFLPGAKPAPQLTGMAFRFDDRRYTAEVGKPILDEADQPVAGLTDWRLSYANNSLAIFSSDDADAVVRIEK